MGTNMVCAHYASIIFGIIASFLSVSIYNTILSFHICIHLCIAYYYIGLVDETLTLKTIVCVNYYSL